MRIALAVAAGFTWSVATGDVIPFLGPLFAAQFLMGSSRPIPFAKAAGMALIILLAGLFFEFLTVLTGARPPVFLLIFGLVYFACFLAQASGKGGPALFLVLVVGVMVPLLGILHIDLGESVLLVLVKGVASGAILTWLAWALIPEIGGEDAPPPAPPAHARPVRRALADTAILLLAMTLCLTREELATAVVIPITVVTLLSQLDVAASGRAALGLVLVNLVGGVAASLVFSVLELRQSLLLLFLLVLFVGLVFGGRSTLSNASAKVWAGALTIFLLVLGSGISPLPGSAAESFATRIGYILLAIVYTILFTALLWPNPSAARETRRH